MNVYKPRFEGTRWVIVYGNYEGVENFAVNELQREVQRSLPYVMGIHRNCDRKLLEQNHVIFVGTAENKPSIKEAIQNKSIKFFFKVG